MRCRIGVGRHGRLSADYVRDVSDGWVARGLLYLWRDRNLEMGILILGHHWIDFFFILQNFKLLDRDLSWVLLGMLQARKHENNLNWT